MDADDRRLQATFWPAARVPTEGHLALWGLPADELPAAASALELPTGEAATLPTVPAAHALRTDEDAGREKDRAALPTLRRLLSGPGAR